MERGDSEETHNRNSTKTTPQASASSSKIVQENSNQADWSDEKPKAKENWFLAYLKTMNPYKLKLAYFFVFLLSLLILMRIAMFGLRIKFGNQNFEDYEKLRKESLEAKFSVGGYLFNLIYHQNPSFLMLCISLIFMILCYQTVLTDEEKVRVNTYKVELERLAGPVPRSKFSDPNLPERPQFIKLYSALSRVMGEKNFRMNIMRVEFLKEVISLDWVTFMVFNLLVSPFRQSKEEAHFRKITLLVEFILAAFICYKNVVYLDTRLSSQRPSTIMRKAAPIIYLLLFFIKTIHVVVLSVYISNVLFSVLSVVLAFGLFRLADRFNDSRQLNTIRVNLYNVFYHK